MIRGGHIDIAVLGAFEVSERGDLANWRRPGRAIGNIGGAMDLAASAMSVIVAMEHTDPDGRAKIVRQCSMDLTGARCVKLIITDVAVIAVTAEGLLLREMAPGWTPQDIQAITEPELLLAPKLKTIEL